MVSPLGPILVDFFKGMTKASRPREIVTSSRVYLRFLDHLFCVADSAFNVCEVLRQFIAASNLVRLTIEEKVNKQVLFLDILLNKKQKVVPKDLHTKRRHELFSV